MIIGITGTLGAGKGTVVEHLIKKGFKHYSARGYLNEILTSQGKELSRENMVELANELRKDSSPSHIAEKLFEAASKNGGDAVIESLRTVGEIESLRKKGNFKLLAVDADPRIRYTRIKKRDSSTDNITYEEFVNQELKEITSKDPNKQNLLACMKLANYKIQNDGTLKALERKLKLILKDIDKKRKKITPQKIQTKRKNITWDEYFMNLALQAAQKSKDPSTKVGACIVDEDNRIISLGYNGFPKGIDDDLLPMDRDGDTLNTKYVYIVHAEENAILNSSRSLKGAKLYATLHPCNECTKSIIQSGIKEVIYLEHKYKDLPEYVASAKMLKLARIKARQFIPNLSKLSSAYNSIKDIIANTKKVD